MMSRKQTQTPDELHTQIQYRLIEQLAESEQRYRQLVENLHEIVFEIDAEGCLTFLNQAWTNLLGHSRESSIQHPISDFFHDRDRKIGFSFLDTVLNQRLSLKQELRFDCQNGKVVWLEVSAHPDCKGGASGTLTDITQHKQTTAQLQYTAHHDTLTSLLNRVAFVDCLEQTIAQTQQQSSEQLFAVLFLDLDGFKLINDSLGHLTGDLLLIAVAHRIQGCLRSSDTVARFGGDEFTILLKEIQDISDATHIAARIHQALTQPFNLGGNNVFISTSIGIALSTTGGKYAEDFLRDADIALYQAKSQGKSTYEVFDAVMHAQAVEQLQLETDLRLGLERDEFEVYYQPIVGLDQQQIIGFEALVRWHHPTQGLISPAKFIPIAEETGLIVNLGGWVLRQACLQMQNWQHFNPSQSLVMSVNLSSKQFLQPNLLEQIDRILQETGFDRHQLKLEITESTLMNNLETTNAKLKKIHASGIQLSIDDFGTGYSSLSYLHRFPINTLKIDRSFVSRLGKDGGNLEIVKAIIALARSLKMDTIAEGVETAEQLGQLRQLGCRKAQGYLFSPPASASEIAALCKFKPQLCFCDRDHKGLDEFPTKILHKTCSNELQRAGKWRN